MGALDQIVRSGKALYAGISMYGPDLTRKAAAMLKGLGTRCLIHQPNYSIMDRWIEDGLTNVLKEESMGCIVFSPLAQGQLTGRYLKGIPADSRAAKPHGFLKTESVQTNLPKILALNAIAEKRGQSLAEMAIAWVLRQPCVTSALLGASSIAQPEENLKALKRLDFSPEELEAINKAVN